MTRKLHQLAVLAAICAAALACAGVAFASFAPSFSATTEANGTAITYTQAPTADPLALLKVYVAADYNATLADIPGTNIGTATARFASADLNTTLNTRGAVSVTSASTGISWAGAPTTVGDLSQQCTGTAKHDAFWLLDLTSGGQTIQVPVYVDDVPITDPASLFANDLLWVCFPAPDLAAGAAGRAPYGAKLLDLSLRVGVFSASEDTYLWHALATPYTPATGVANAAAAVEMESVDRTPQALTVSAKPGRVGQHAARVSGRLTAGGSGVAGAKVTIRVGGKTAVTVTTSRTGNFAATLKLHARRGRITAVATARSHVAACRDAEFTSLVCTGATNPGFTLTSKAVVVAAR